MARRQLRRLTPSVVLRAKIESNSNASDITIGSASLAAMAGQLRDRARKAGSGFPRQAEGGATADQEIAISKCRRLTANGDCAVQSERESNRLFDSAGAEIILASEPGQASNKERLLMTKNRPLFSRACYSLPSVSVVPLLLTACGTFQLASGIYPPPGKTADQQQMDILVCKDKAKLEANTAERQAGAFMLGMTIVGAPIAYEMEKAKQREVFATCLSARGYRVDPAADAGNIAPAASRTTQQASLDRNVGTLRSTEKAAPSSTSAVGLSLPAGFELRPVSEQQKAAGAILSAVNRTTDVGVQLSVTKREGITDLASFAQARRAGQANRLTQAEQSEIIEVKVAGQSGYQFHVTGSYGSQRYTYFVTVVAGSQEIAQVNSWTTATNFPQQRESMAKLAETLTGI